MKQYNRIMVPDERGDYEVCDVEYITPERGRLSPEDNVIVLTIEELREVWAMAKSGPDYPGVFELFLKSKGIDPTK